jgi:hypothetical protein
LYAVKFLPYLIVSTTSTEHTRKVEVKLHALWAASVPGEERGGLDTELTKTKILSLPGTELQTFNRRKFT